MTTIAALAAAAVARSNGVWRKGENRVAIQKEEAGRKSCSRG